MRQLGLATMLVLLSALVGASCGGGDDDGGGGQGMTSVRVGVIPITAVAPVYLGVEQGFFKREGLRVEPVPAQGGAAIVPAVQSASSSSVSRTRCRS